MRPFKLAASFRGSGLCWPAAVTAAVFIAACAFADEPSPPGELTPFARYVPADAGFFVSVQRLDEVSQALTKAHADRILALLTGTDVSQFPSFDPRTLVTAFSHSQAKPEGEDLRSAGFGIAAKSWPELLDGVLFVQTPAESGVQRWFPQGRSARISPTTRIVRVEEEIVACVRDNVVALSRQSGTGTMMRETLRLMAGRSSEAIVGAETFQELVHYLPARPIALAYLSQAPPPAPLTISPMDDPPPADALPAEEVPPVATQEPEEGKGLRNAVAGMYDRGGRLDFALRGTRAAPLERESIADQVLAKVKSLPQSTVLVWAGTHGLDSVLRGDFEEYDGVLARYGRLLAGLRRREGADAQIPPLGRNAIIALDRDATAERATPQFAAMIDSTDSREVATEFSDAVDAFLDLIYSMDTVEEQDAPFIELWTHDQTPVSTVDLKRYARASRFRGAALVRNLAPSWAALDGWFVFTTTKEQMTRVLDAAAGTGATFGDLPEAKAALSQTGKRNALTLVRGSALAELLIQWLRDAERGAPSILNRATLAKNALSSGPRPEELGLVLRETPAPGEVIVEDVTPGSSAHGQLYPEDRVIAIDGRVLNLSLASRDFEQRLASGTSSTRTLRVLRGDEVVDVTLSTPPVAVNLPAIPLDPGAATRELALIVREVEFASFFELNTEPSYYAALASVRFVPAPQPLPPPAEPMVETTPLEQAD